MKERKEEMEWINFCASSDGVRENFASSPFASRFTLWEISKISYIR